MRVVLQLAAVSLAAIGALVVLSGSTQGGAIIDNGVVQIGVNDFGNLNMAGGLPSSGTGVTVVGLRYMPTGAESTAPGCLCEGWGVAYDGAVAGYANEASGTGGIVGVSFTSTTDSAISVVDVGDLRVTHDYHPSITDNLYEVHVTVLNQGSSFHDVVYRRVMDWDIEPTAFSEFVTIDTPGGGPPSELFFSSDNGFASADPLTGPSSISFIGPPTGAATVDDGPGDHGALFDFNLGTVGPNQSTDFFTYYGAAGTESDALDALNLVGAQVWSLGQCNPGSNPSCDLAAGTPNTFVFAHGFEPPPPPDFVWTFTTTEPYNYTYDPVQFNDTSPPPDQGFVSGFEWDFGDGGTATGANPVHTYTNDGVYKVCMTRIVSFGGAKIVKTTVCKFILVNNRAPVADFVWSDLMNSNPAVYFGDTSTDMDGLVSAWQWDLGDGSPLILTQSFAPHHYLPPGIYNVCLTIADDDGAMDVHCEDVVGPNVPPLMEDPIDVVWPEGNPIFLALMAYDPDGYPVNCFNGGVPSGSVWNPGGCSLSWSYPMEGSYAGITFWATDPHGGLTSQTWNVLVVKPPLDADGDGIADVADPCPSAVDCDTTSGGSAGGSSSGGDVGRPRGGVTASSDAPPALEPILLPDGAGTDDDAPLDDTDGDGVEDVSDNCVAVPNRLQGDLDGDRSGDACDMDVDGDGVPQVGSGAVGLDNCPTVPNSDQADADLDGVGEACRPLGASQAGALDSLSADPASRCSGCAVESLRGNAADADSREVLSGRNMGLAGSLLAALAVSAVLTVWALRRRTE